METTRTEQKSRISLPLAAGVVSVIIGVAVLFGWAFDIPVLKSIQPIWVSMKANSALGFVFFGMALVLLNLSSNIMAYRAARLCSLATGLIGALTLSEIIFDWHPGFDQWLFTEPVGAVGTSHPGLMAPATAFCLLMLAIAFEFGWNKDTTEKSCVSVTICLAVVIIAVAELLCHFLWPTDTFGLWGLTVMAVHTAMLLAMLGISLALYSWPTHISLFSPMGKMVASFAVWTILLVGSLVWNLQLHGHDTVNDALYIARANIRKDISFRKWATSHGGVYVKPTDQTPPNPYLKHPHRDLESTSGIRLTLMNPAYMLREMQNGFGDDYGSKSRITSLKPINPKNAPDPWETKILKRFEKSGENEFFEISLIEGKPYLRMMRPFLVEAGCLNCHAEQGYKIGDIRGGIGSSVPMEQILMGHRTLSTNITVAHGMIWGIGMLGLFTFYRRENLLDITAKKETAFSDTVINSLPGTFHAYEDGKRLVRWNKNLEADSGYSAAELLNKNPFDWFADKHKAVAVAAFHEISDGGETDFEADIVYKNSTIPSYLTVSHLMLGEKKFVICIGLDLTNQKKMELELIQSQKMESVGRLAGGVAHDFNNMLTIISGYAELSLLEIDASNPVAGHLKQISATAHRSADLTRQLLAFARKQTVDPKVVNLNEAITGMLKMLQRIIGENIQLIWLPAPDLWQIKIDPSQIDQILANLSVNARDAIADTGKITIETGNVTVDKESEDQIGCAAGEYVKIVMNDSGCGMDKETQSHIFEPFYTTKELGMGTGLGLATIYGAVKQNNGHISVYSEPGLGSAFSIYLPRYKEQTAVPVSKEPVTISPHGKETILLVEDEAAILRLTSTLLEKLGYTVLAAHAPGEAVAIAGKHAGEIHLLMTDVIMPEMNGSDLSKVLLPSHPDMKCLFMSGYTADIITKHGVLDNGVHFIQKPFSLPDLATKVREVFESR
ncbi:MAG: DUF3365 domain-containing protein [Desulfuromonadaceae bacterium]|nr:DUF3365 domain-containing protein [Desulfuromonadaceae bacterium]